MKHLSIEQFKSLILPSTPESSLSSIEISTLSPASFDPRNQYSTVIHAVRTAVSTTASAVDAYAHSLVKIFRVQLTGTRFEYWVVGLDREGSRIVGMKAKAIES